jgi:hypothetical protein
MYLSCAYDKKWCYNIVFFLSRKRIDFKGRFFGSMILLMPKKIIWQLLKVNINWVKDIYIEQEFEVISDSVFF